jgi:LPS export ABC transporter protein LptC
LKAATGVLHNADRRVELHDNVVVWRDGPQGRNELRTSKLVYLPDARRVQTDQPVKLISPTSTTDGVGLDGDLERQTYRLLAQVRSVHQPR